MDNSFKYKVKGVISDLNSFCHQLTIFTNNATGETFCFLSNEDSTTDANINLDKDGTYFVPAWSVSILQNCNKEIYNTAKVKRINFNVLK